MKLEPSKPSLLYGILITLQAYVCFAIVAALVRKLGNFPTIQIIFFQSLISLIVLMPHFLKKRLYKVKKNLIPLHLIRSITGIASFFCYFFAIKKLNLVDATILTYTAPFFTPIVWSLWTKEKMEKGIWWIIILGFIGIGLILKPDSFILNPGALIALLSAVFGSFTLVAIRKLNQNLECLTRIMFNYFLIGTIISLPFVITWWQTPTLFQIELLISIGILFGLGQLFLTIGYKHGTASFLSPISYSMIIFTGIISWMFFKQVPGWLSFIGALIIITGGTISYIIKTKPDKFIKIFEHNGEEKTHWWKRFNHNHETLQENENTNDQSSTDKDQR